MGIRYAVVGATGNVGREMLQILAERDVPADDVTALASSRSVGAEVSYGEDDVLEVGELAGFDFGATDIVLSSPGARVSAEHSPRAAAAGVGRLLHPGIAAAKVSHAGGPNLLLVNRRQQCHFARRVGRRRLGYKVQGKGLRFVGLKHVGQRDVVVASCQHGKVVAVEPGDRGATVWCLDLCQLHRKVNRERFDGFMGNNDGTRVGDSAARQKTGAGARTARRRPFRVFELSLKGTS